MYGCICFHIISTKKKNLFNINCTKNQKNMERDEDEEVDEEPVNTVKEN